MNKLQEWLNYSVNREFEFYAGKDFIQIFLEELNDAVYCYNYNKEHKKDYEVICNTNNLEEVINIALDKWEELYGKDE